MVKREIIQLPRNFIIEKFTGTTIEVVEGVKTQIKITDDKENQYPV